MSRGAYNCAERRSVCENGGSITFEPVVQTLHPQNVAHHQLPCAPLGVHNACPTGTISAMADSVWSRLLLRPCQPRQFLRGTLPSFASPTGSPPCASWPCSSPEWKFSSLIRASIGVKPATYKLLHSSRCRSRPPGQPFPPATVTCFPTRTAGAAICISKPPGWPY